MTTLAPYSLDAEQAVLGALLFDNESYQLVGALRAAHFYDPAHTAIYEAIERAIRAGELADGVTMRAYFMRESRLTEIGGAGYLLTLLENAAKLSRDVEHYATLIVDLSKRRALWQLTNEIGDLAAQGADNLDADDMIARAEAGLAEIAHEGGGAEVWTPIAQVTGERAERAELGEMRGMSTGFAELDACIGGLLRKKLYIAGGASSMGKSIFGAAVSRAVAGQGFGVGEHHLEMDHDDIGLRTATALAFRLNRTGKNNPDGNPTYLDAAAGKLKRWQWEALREAAKRAEALPIFVDARSGRTVAQIEAAARRLLRRMEKRGIVPGMLLIDHEGLIQPDPRERHPSMLERASARAEALHAMADRLNVAVLALCQLTNDGARQDGKEALPTMQDCKYGGALTQAAQAVMLIHRASYYAERKPAHLREPTEWHADGSFETTIIVDKARGGRRGHVKVCMDVSTAAMWSPVNNVRSAA